MAFDFTAFDPPGPVGQAFMNCRAPVKFIRGPIGSGKTSCMIMDTIHDAGRQPPSKVAFETIGGARVPIRLSKAFFVRETFRQLYDTTIPSWWSWVPKSYGEWRGGGSETANHEVRFVMPPCARYETGTIVKLTAQFGALGDQNVEGLFRGKESNLLRLNEADTLSPEVLNQGILRIKQGRYPGERHVHPSQCVKNVAGDYNAPDVENYLYALAEENRPAGWEFFVQPGGMQPDAENRARATLEDYQAMEADLIAQGREDLARRMIHNQYGFTRDGKPVYPEYRDDFHCAGVELMPVKGIPVKVDFDQGLHPAAILRQTMPNGQLRVLDELYGDGGATGLCEELRRLIGSAKYAGHRVIGGRCDPAAAARDGNDAESWVDCVNRLMGWRGAERVRVADTNAPEKRQGAVRFRLRTNVDGGQPGLLISTACRVMRKGFNSSYRFKSKAGRRGEYHDQAEKAFPVSDVHDALQYGALDDGGYEEVVGRESRKARQTDFNRRRTAKVEVRI